MKYNPDWDFNLWTLDELIMEIDISGIGFGISDALNNPKLHYSCKSDIARWLVLYLYGGVYADTDVECLAPFDVFLNNEMFVGKSYPPNGIGNAVIGATQGHPLSLKILVAITNACMTDVEATNKNVVDMTVNLSGKMLEECPTIYPQHYFYPYWCDDIKDDFIQNVKEKYPDSYAVHHWSGMLPDGWTWETIKKPKPIIEEKPIKADDGNVLNPLPLADDGRSLIYLTNNHIVKLKEVLCENCKK
jgi:inositol phosphorylceramide mannosyltransferase catalytic subunit